MPSILRNSAIESVCSFRRRPREPSRFCLPWKDHAGRRPASGAWKNLEAPSHRFHEAFRDREPDARSVYLGREEGIEYLFAGAFGKARSPIHDEKFRVFPVAPDLDFHGRSVLSIEAFDGVPDKVLQYGPEPVRIEEDADSGSSPLYSTGPENLGSSQR